jgi:hypothetical protein
MSRTIVDAKRGCWALLFLVHAAVTCSSSGSGSAVVAVEVPIPPRQHPRVRMTPARVADLKALTRTDPAAKALLSKVLARADGLLTDPPVKYGHTGVEHSLLAVSREVCDRAYSLGLSFLLTGQQQYAARAIKEMVAVAAFPDWNPAHFLDTAEMTHCVGIGYDWVFAEISDTNKSTIEAGILKNGFEAYLQRAYPKNEWARGEWNWNQVVNGGLTAGALAFSDVLPLSAAVLGNATAGIQAAFHSYAPSGAWPEGLGYWGYGTNYALVFIDSMLSATGADGGASASPGFNQTGAKPLLCHDSRQREFISKQFYHGSPGLFCVHGTGPSWRAFNWGDSGDGGESVFIHAILHAYLYSELGLRDAGCDQGCLEHLGALYPSLRKSYSAFAAEIRATIEPDPSGNSDTGRILVVCMRKRPRYASARASGVTGDGAARAVCHA